MPVIRPEFSASVRVVRPDVVLVAFTGDLDRDTLSDAKDAVRRATADGPDHLVVDLSEVVFMGSDGISLLVAAHQGRGGSHGALHVVGITHNRQVLRPLQLMNLVDVLDVAEDVDAVLARIDGVRPASDDAPAAPAG